ncbi:hypothetical protein CERSUDRAFT_105714 [Gelatoporia subvermispora B]|uniref:F-box domain-containing protein n=1 Tax=Ceriporiopsis subvermispora (strain B) TaxID=914234 RepID=M2QZY7_CERS8|nr:hypothetical protein CERSUDRAFT_105714 [Gelatoporia subvermispora B]
MPMTTIPLLPPEVTDRIIDYLWADRTSLRNCALTCRAWSPVSRYHLFHTLRIWSREAFDSLTHKSCVPRTAELFRFVQHLSLREQSGSTFTYLVPPLLVNKLPKVTSMDIHNFSTETVAIEPSFYTVLGRFDRLTTLELSDVNLGSIHGVSLFLCSFPRLERLTFQRCTIRRLFLPAQQSAPLKTLSLTALTISEVQQWTLRDFLSWLITTSTIQTLQTFVYRGGEGHNSHGTTTACAELLVRLFHGVGSSLKAINIPLLNGIDDHRHLLSASSGVRIVYFHFDANNDATAARYLSHIISTQLVTVELLFDSVFGSMPFDMHIPGRPPIPSSSRKFRDIRASLKNIDQVLASESFPLLEQVIVRSSCSPFSGLSRQSFHQKIRRSMRRLQARGILRFAELDTQESLQ